MKAPQTVAHNQVPDDVELTLSELREMASRQQQQIDDHQQQLVAKEQRLRYLKQQENRQQTMNSEAERLRRLRERVEAQEMKLRKLRSLRGQSEQQRVTNTALIVDLENIRALFNEKEKELSVAVARVEEMSRQLEEVKRGRQLRHGSHGETHLELEKLRRELMYRNRLNEQQQKQLIGQRQLIGQKRDEMARVDQRIAELQQRLHRKRAHNQQLAAQVQSVSAAKRQVRQSNAVAELNAPPHAPFTAPSKSDPKYQTLPYNTKFSARPHQSDPAKTPVAPPVGQQDNHRVRAPPLGAANGQVVSSGVRVTSSLPRPVQSVSSLQSVQPPSSGNTTDNNIANNNNNNSSNDNNKSNNHNTAVALQSASETSDSRPFLPPKPGNQWRHGDAEHATAAVSNREEMARVHRLGRCEPTVTDSDDSSDPTDRVNANRPDLTVSDEPDRVAVGHTRTASLPADVATYVVDKTQLPTAADNNNTASPPSRQQQQQQQQSADTDSVFVEGDDSRCDRRRKPSNLRHPGSSSSSLLRTRRVSFDPLALLLDASLEGELELVKKTAVEVVDPSASNDEGITALHNAICAGHLEIVQFLVEFGCDVNAQDSDGWTPLHCAASCNNLPMVRFLVEHGACIFASTLSDQETAAEKCEEDEEGYHGCSEYLYSIQEKLGILNSGRVYALFPYSSQNADELTLADGQPLTVLRKGDEVERDWWWARTVEDADNSEGYIPRNLLGLYPRVGRRVAVTEQVNSE